MSVQRIVVGVTETETSQLAARRAVEFASATGATVIFVTAVRKDREVVEVGGDRWEFSTLDEAQLKINQFVQSLDAGVSHSVVARDGDPAEVLLQEAERVDADLIVVGNVRMQGIGRVLGSVGSAVLHRAPCDVLIVKTV